MAGPSLPVSSVWASLVAGGFAAGGIPYIATDNTPTIDTANLFWDATNKRLHVVTAGDITGTDSINTYKQQDTFQFNSQIPGVTPWLSALSPQMTVSSSRGNANLNAASLDSDFIGGFFAWAYIPLVPLVPTYTPIAGIWGTVSGVDANGNYGGYLSFGTKQDSGIFVERLRLDASGILFPIQNSGAQLGKTGLGYAALYLDFTAPGGVGDKVINKASGRANIAAGAIGIVITNNKVVATSIVLAVLETVDATAKSVVATPGAGFINLTLNANCTAQVAVSFVVIGN